MSFRTDMTIYLEGFAGLAALVSDRIRPLAPLQGETFPMVSYRVVAEDPEHEINGDAGVTERRVRFVAWGGTSYGSADAVNEQLRLAMSGFRGTFGSTVINSVQKENERDVIAYAQDGSDMHTVGIETDYLIKHQQAKPSF